MQTEGNRAQTAEINKKADQALAEGYAETYRTIDEVLSGIETISNLEKLGVPAATLKANTGYSSAAAASAAAQDEGATALNKNITKMRREFAKGQIESNYQADMNSIEYETVQMYYNVLLATENYRIAQENVLAKKEILKDTESMLKTGMAAKKEVLAVMADLAEAESDAQAAKTTLETAKMGFNYLLDYPILQTVTLTDPLKEIEAPTLSLEDAIAKALASRNEIKGTAFAEDVYEMLIKNISLRYSKTSSTYLNQEVEYLNAQKTAKDAITKVEIDIRCRYQGLQDKRAALEKAEKTLEYANEGYRLTKLSYSVGMSKLSDVQSMQVTCYLAALGKAAAVKDYDLAVYEFRYASSIGTYRLPL